MFSNGQIVYDLRRKVPCVAYSSIGRLETHFIRPTGEGEKVNGYWQERYAIFMPESIAEAQTLLDAHRIVPAPLAMTHCHLCGNWKTNHNKDGSCWERRPLPLFEMPELEIRA